MEIGDGGGESFPQIVPYTVLSIDLGETTGVAAYDFYTCNLRHASTNNFHALFPLLALLQPTEIILERFPIAHSLEYQIEIAYRQLAMKSVLISPSAWKPFMKSRKRKYPSEVTQHEQDAINMLRYYLITTFQKDIP